MKMTRKSLAVPRPFPLALAILLAGCCAAAILAGRPAKAQNQNCPTSGVSVPVQHIKIFNDSHQYLYPVLDTGQNPNPLGDIWMQAIFSVPNSKTPFGMPPGTCSYGEDLDFRIYINEASGIEPGGSVDITVPLFTQLAATPDPTQTNQWVDWWRGENIWIYANSAATPPRALQEYHDNPIRQGTMDPYLPGQKPLKSAAANPTLPTCTYTPPNSAPVSCVLNFFSDPASLPINGPGQLFEATLGARVQQKVVNDSPPNTLDTQNADFDVSYVDVAYMTGAMGPFANDQVGYVGSALGPGEFQTVLTAKFLKDFPNWPQFRLTYADGTTAMISKLASPSNALARLTGANPPADLPLAKDEHWPTSVWGPIQALRNNWTTWAGKPGQSGQCANPLSGNAAWCKAVLDVKTLFQANYQQYLTLFKNGTCTGGSIPNTDPTFADRFLAHVYGWTPWIEAALDSKGNPTGAGCSPTANLLQNTPGYTDNSYALYSAVKLEFDNVEYGKQYTPPPGVVFNPWVQFLHGVNYLNIPGVYAYSVDDAVGNIQAEATGYIIDVGSLKNLENQSPAAPPITVSLGYDPDRALNYLTYRLCNNTTSTIKNVNPSFPSFVLSANAPQNCPVFLTDNGMGKTCDDKMTPCPQTYTFTVTQPPPNESGSVTPTDWVTFTLAQKDAGEPRWSGAGGPATFNTAKVINCSGNTGPFDGPPNGSSKAWCCALTTKAGVWAYSFPEPASAHNALVHVVDAGNPQISNTSTNMTCSQGQ
jgi:hypothetical protein